MLRVHAIDAIARTLELLNHADYDRAAGGHRLGLESRWKDLPRTALESLVFETRLQVDAFLKEHEIFDYSAADFEQDRETLRELRMREARP
jgi:hypothetical protein